MNKTKFRRSALLKIYRSIRFDVKRLKCRKVNWIGLIFFFLPENFTCYAAARDTRLPLLFSRLWSHETNIFSGKTKKTNIFPVRPNPNLTERNCEHAWRTMVGGHRIRFKHVHDTRLLVTRHVIIFCPPLNFSCENHCAVIFFFLQCRFERNDAGRDVCARRRRADTTANTGDEIGLRFKRFPRQ